MAAALSWGSSVCGVRVSAEAPVRRVAAAGPLVIEAAHKKGGGSTRNKSDSNAQRLGVKVYGDQPCMPGNIIIRQRGTLWTPGPGTDMGKDHTIFAVVEGMVKFDRSATRARICVVPHVEEPVKEGPVVETRRTRKFAKYPPRQSSPPEAVALAR